MMLCKIGQISLMNRPAFLARSTSFYQTPEKDERPWIECSTALDCSADLPDDEQFLTPDLCAFSTFGGEDDFEPIPMGEHRTPYEQAALYSMLEESVEFLFSNASSSQRNPILPNHTASDPSHGSEQKLQTLPETSGSSYFQACSKKRSREYSLTPWADDDLNVGKPPAKKARRSPSAAGPSMFRFREYQSIQWDQRYENLLSFLKANGHCSVPYCYPQNPSLARWVKRQRYQYKLHMEAKPSTMTEQRIQALERIGFIWDAHSAAWEERLSDLRNYRAAYGDCNVPTNYERNKKLAAWVKCQRRQYKLHSDGKTSTLTEDRIATLNEMGFRWEVRAFKVPR